MAKFEMKPLISWDEYENGVKEDIEAKKVSDLVEKFCYGTSEPLWNRNGVTFNK